MNESASQYIDSTYIDKFLISYRNLYNATEKISIIDSILILFLDLLLLSSAFFIQPQTLECIERLSLL